MSHIYSDEGLQQYTIKAQERKYLYKIARKMKDIIKLLIIHSIWH